MLHGMGSGGTHTEEPDKRKYAINGLGTHRQSQNVRTFTTLRVLHRGSTYIAVQLHTHLTLLLPYGLAVRYAVLPGTDTVLSGTTFSWGPRSRLHRRSTREDPRLTTPDFGSSVAAPRTLLACLDRVSPCVLHVHV